jgi:hypothetical protein
MGSLKVIVNPLLVATVRPVGLVTVFLPAFVRRCQWLKPLAWTPTSGPGVVVFRRRPGLRWR